MCGLLLCASSTRVFIPLGLTYTLTVLLLGYLLMLLT